MLALHAVAVVTPSKRAPAWILSCCAIALLFALATGAWGAVWFGRDRPGATTLVLGLWNSWDGAPGMVRFLRVITVASGAVALAAIGASLFAAARSRTVPRWAPWATAGALGGFIAFQISLAVWRSGVGPAYSALLALVATVIACWVLIRQR